MKLENISQMAKASERPQKPEKSQAELRAALEQKLRSLKVSIQEGIKEYEQALKDNLFEDGEGETTGAGEERKKIRQKKLETLLAQAEKEKAKLDSPAEIPQSSPEISTTYTHPDGHQETIQLDIEEKLKDFLSFYLKTKLDVPPDFADTIREIWERNQTEIEEAIEQNGFDEILIIPGNIPLPDLAEKMKMENGYWEGSNFKEDGGFAGAVSQNVDKPRLILAHKTKNLQDRPELAKTKNTKGQDVKLDETLTLEDYLIFQRKYFEETKEHLDEIGWVWLATKSGARLVYSCWYPGDRSLYVNAYGLGYQDDYLGVRLSRCFY